MNIEDERQAIAAAIADITPDGWQVSTATDPNVYSGLIHIGHATEVRQDTMDEISFGLPIAAWINESEDVLRVRDLYSLLSGGQWSILQFLNSSSLNAVIIGDFNVESRFKGTGDWLVAEASVRLSYALDANAL